jgi:hypothetical protein
LTGDVGFACGAATGLPACFATATTAAFLTTGFATGFFGACFFATGFFAACFLATGLREADFGAFLWTGFRDFADDLRTGFLAMGILNGAVAAARGRSGTAGHHPQLGAARENLKSYHAVAVPGSSGCICRRVSVTQAGRHFFPNCVGGTGKTGRADGVGSAENPWFFITRTRQNHRFFVQSLENSRPARPIPR